jgi:formate hydrogenlyase transcriptional activator
MTITHVELPFHDSLPSIHLHQRCEALFRVTKAISSHRDLKQMFCVMAAELRQVVDYDAIVVAQVNAESGDVSCWHVAQAFGSPACGRVPPPTQMRSDIERWVYDLQRPLVIPDIQQETRFEAVLDRLRGFGVRALCMLPLTTVHRRIGAIGLASRRPEAYGDVDMSFMALVADQVAMAIDNAVNFESSLAAQEESRKNSERLEILLRITNAMASNLDLRQLFAAVSANIRTVMRGDGVGLALPDKETGKLKFFAVDFPDSRVGLSDRSAPPEIMQEVFDTGLIKNETAVDYLPNESAKAEGIASGCILPLKGRDRILGTLSVARRASLPFSAEDLSLLNEIAAQVAIAVENALAYQDVQRLKEQLAQENVYLEHEIRSELNFEDIVGHSEALLRVLKQVEVVAPTDSTVLICGETGTGKELIARALHNLGARSKNAFVKVNCAAIPSGLLESEIFGHERGAFTGAVSQRIGRFELADKGTVFLDEIGEIPLELQPKLLRVLQEGEFERLGNPRTLKTNARLVAATNRDLAAMVAGGKFRADLFYRLNVFPVVLPALRDRKEDIPLLVRHYVQQFARRMNKPVESIRSEDMKVLCNYSWPGNIRELQNLIERAVILSTGKVLNLPMQDLHSAAAASNAPGGKLATLDEAERRHILDALNACNWVIAGSKGAANLLGMKRSTLQTRMGKLGIRRARAAAYAG